MSNEQITTNNEAIELSSEQLDEVAGGDNHRNNYRDNHRNNHRNNYRDNYRDNYRKKDYHKKGW
jgi:hypothetical protein